MDLTTAFSDDIQATQLAMSDILSRPCRIYNFKMPKLHGATTMQFKQSNGASVMKRRLNIGLAQLL